MTILRRSHPAAVVGCDRFPGKGHEDELRQLEHNRRFWPKRVAMIQSELTSDPKRVAELYEVKARRIEPVGLVYLWPVTG